MLARPRPVLAALLAASLASTAHAADTCPNEQTTAAADANLGHCLGDAREARKANEPRLAAAAYGRAVKFAREAYDAGKPGAPAEWFTEAGEQIVHYGTEGCALATNLPDERAREILGTCIGLLDTYLADLAGVSPRPSGPEAADSRSAQVARQRRDELQPLLAALTPKQPEPVPEPTTAPPATPPSPPPAQPPPATVRDAPPPPPPKSPRGLDAGLGVSAALAGLSVVGIVAADQLGRKANTTVLSGPEAAGASEGVDVCATTPSAAGCSDLRSAKNLFIASGVLLGVTLAATVVFAGLRIRHARSQRRTRAAHLAPSWAGLTVRF